jgi:phosphonate transport system substrate-binding protein
VKTKHPVHLPNQLKFVLILLVILGLTVALAQNDCPRGDLDERYCDWDGDLVADLPEDPSEWLDPNVLVFAFSPGEDPATYRDAWGEFLAHMEDVTGKRTQFFAVETYAAQVEAMRAGRLHVAGVPTGAVPSAVNRAGFVPIKMMALEDASYGYSMIVIVHRDSDIHSLEDLEGRQIAFVAPQSNSGYLAPVALLNDELGWLPDNHYRTTFSGDHDNSIFGVVHRDYEAATTASGVLARLADQGVIDLDDIRIIYESDLFPDVAYGHLYNLHPDLAEKIREAFRTFEWEGSGLQRQWGPEGRTQFIPITYEEHWRPIRVVEEKIEALGLDH